MKLFFRRVRYWLWAVTRAEIPNRRDEAWVEKLRAMNADGSWNNVRFKSGALRDPQGRFTNPDKSADIAYPATEIEVQP